LAHHARLDLTVHAMLLRQLYLALFENRAFVEALDIANQALELNVLPDILHQDAARAALASGDTEAAVVHLRAAARRGPPSRRPQHLWTLGGTLFLARRYGEAGAALERAVRWATRERPLYRAHLALVRHASGEPLTNVREVMDALAEAPCGQGYGRFVLGHLAFAAGDWSAAKRYLEAFLKRTLEGRSAMGIALEGELQLSKSTLAKMQKN
jgi:tetratricopeptide (TPR) repeat protein